MTLCVALLSACTDARDPAERDVARGTVSFREGAQSRPADSVAQRRGIEAVLSEHIARYPAMQIQDLYKLVHQGAYGSEHAMPGYQQALDWLSSELVRLAAEGPGAGDLPGPLVEALAPDGEIVRVHLRPYLKNGWDPGPLLEAFVRTAAEYPRSPDRLRAFAEAAEGMARDGRLPFAADSVTAFFARLEEDGFPAMHHSERYQEQYQPAYRVIAGAFLPESLRVWSARADGRPRGR